MSSFQLNQGGLLNGNTEWMYIGATTGILAKYTPKSHIFLYFFLSYF